MNYSMKKGYTFNSGETKCMVIIEGDCWEVYYRKPGFSYQYAFGLPKKEERETVLSLALANIEEYSDLFDEPEA